MEIFEIGLGRFDIKCAFNWERLTNKQSYSNNHVYWKAFGPLVQELYELVNLSNFFVNFKLFKIILGYYTLGYFRL